MTNDEQIRRANRAAEILGDPLVVEALAALRERVVTDWRTSAVGEREEREVYYFLNCAIEDFEAHFRSLVTSGEFAAHRVAAAEQARKADNT